MESVLRANEGLFLEDAVVDHTQLGIEFLPVSEGEFRLPGIETKPA